MSSVPVRGDPAPTSPSPQPHEVLVDRLATARAFGRA